MLNRRTLRIKIMQSLFAYEQCKEADYELAQDHVENYFQRDLNSMKVQDKDMLKGQRVVALQLFEKRFKSEPTEESADPRIEKAVKEALSQYTRQLARDFDFFRKAIPVDVENITQFYYAVLNLIPALATVSAADKKRLSENFIGNPFVKAIQNNKELKRESQTNMGHWDSRMELVRGWYRDCIRPDKEFVQFMNLKAPDTEQHKAFIKHLVRKLILGPTAINATFEEDDLHWAEDHEIVKSLVDKSLKSLQEDSNSIELQKLSLDWADDKLFIQKLFEGAAHLDQVHHEMIARNTKNWEVDRLPLTDRIILQMAIAELIEFPGIPVKVTINEYIELAKHYSTPKSRQFINGILDVMSKELKESGKIKKSGRGLVDNK